MTPVFEFPARLHVKADDETHARERAEALADALTHGEAVLLVEPGEPVLASLSDAGATSPDSGTASPCNGSAIARRPGGPSPRR
jgi:hypothetical protein